MLNVADDHHFARYICGYTTRGFTAEAFRLRDNERCISGFLLEFVDECIESAMYKMCTTEKPRRLEIRKNGAFAVFQVSKLKRIITKSTGVTPVVEHQPDEQNSMSRMGVCDYSKSKQDGQVGLEIAKACKNDEYGSCIHTVDSILKRYRHS